MMKIRSCKKNKNKISKVGQCLHGAIPNLLECFKKNLTKLNDELKILNITNKVNIDSNNKNILLLLLIKPFT